jgi:hypothetical protein
MLVNSIQTSCKNRPTLLKQNPNEPVAPNVGWQHP